MIADGVVLNDVDVAMVASNLSRRTEIFVSNREIAGLLMTVLVVVCTV